MKRGILLLTLLVASFSLSVYSQNDSEIITVKGTICDENGRKIRKDVVVSPPSFDGFIVVKNGVYSIDVESGGMLYFTCRGYFPEKVKIENRKKINVVLEKDTRTIIYIRLTVTDEEGKPLEEVKIASKRHPRDLFQEEGVGSVRTNKDGIVTSITSDDNTLIFSLDGYETQKIPVDKRDEIKVVMKKKKEKE